MWLRCLYIPVGSTASPPRYPHHACAGSSASDGKCTLNAARTACDMGASVINAARALASVQGIPASNIAVTAFTGDFGLGFFGPSDAAAVAKYAVAAKLAAVHYWSLDGDRDCDSAPQGGECSLPPGAKPFSFYNAFYNGLYLPPGAAAAAQAAAGSDTAAPEPAAAADAAPPASGSPAAAGTEAAPNVTTMVPAPGRRYYRPAFLNSAVAGESAAEAAAAPAADSAPPAAPLP